MTVIRKQVGRHPTRVFPFCGEPEALQGAALRLDAFFGYAAAKPEDRDSWQTAPSP